MGVALKQLKVYVRGALILVVGVAISLVLVKNRGHSVPFWCFGFTDDARPVNVVWLMICTAAATLVTWWVLSLAWGLLRDMREVKRLRTVAVATRELENRTVELNQRERRVDEKVQRAIAQGDEPEDAEPPAA